MTFRAFPAVTTLSVLLLGAAVAAQTDGTVSATTSVSKVRIVRLSEVKGAVDLDRSNGRGMEPAITNLPIVEHNRLRTAMGVAEVEFEDNSSVRLGPESVLEFPELSRAPGGATISSVHLIKGTAYISLLKTRGNSFILNFGEHAVAVPPGTHLRLTMNSNDAQLAVLDGAVTVDTPHGPLEVSKKKTVTLLTASDIDPTVAKNVEQAPLDTWDKQSSDYHVRLANQAAFGNSGYSYGLSDMMYYGAFSDAGGCGSMWHPYFTSASWDPYSAGAWAYYSGAGYSWVSPYPWGWTPYHYGSWSFCPGAGWGWQPGGAWTGLNNTSMMTMNRFGTGGGRTSPVSPPHPPQPGGPSMVPVISKPLVRSEMKSGNSFEFRNDSAGFGIPRGELGQLNKLSEHAASHGSVSTTVYLSAAPSGQGTVGARPANHGIGTVSVHRGSPPPPPEVSSASAGGGSLGSGSSSPTSSSNSNMSPRSSPSPSPAPTGGGRPR